MGDQTQLRLMRLSYERRVRPRHSRQTLISSRPMPTMRPARCPIGAGRFHFRTQQIFPPAGEEIGGVCFCGPGAYARAAKSWRRSAAGDGEGKSLECRASRERRKGSVEGGQRPHWRSQWHTAPLTRTSVVRVAWESRGLFRVPCRSIGR